jgi:hypothetical protein
VPRCLTPLENQTPTLPSSDWDIFVFGPDDAARRSAVRTLLSVFPDNTTWTQQGAVLSGALVNNPRKVQLIFTDASSARSVVEAFDTTALEAYYDGEHVWASRACVASLCDRVATERVDSNGTRKAMTDARVEKFRLAGYSVMRIAVTQKSSQHAAEVDRQSKGAWGACGTYLEDDPMSFFYGKYVPVLYEVKPCDKLSQAEQRKLVTERTHTTKGIVVHKGRTAASACVEDLTPIIGGYHGSDKNSTEKTDHPGKLATGRTHTTKGIVVHKGRTAASACVEDLTPIIGGNEKTETERVYTKRECVTLMKEMFGEFLLKML